MYLRDRLLLRYFRKKCNSSCHNYAPRIRASALQARVDDRAESDKQPPPCFEAASLVSLPAVTITGGVPSHVGGLKIGVKHALRAAAASL